MKLTLHKFKCWSDLTLNIPVGIVLIRGLSGAGKTSLLKAINWVLYGNTKKISPHSAPSAKTFVKYEYNGITITRSKNPNKLIYDDGTIYEDEEAQHKICYLYGEYSVFLSTSYIAQRGFNEFLVASNVSKMELLNKVAFQDDDPNTYLDKIEQHYVDARANQQCLLDIYKSKVDLIEPFDSQITKYALSDKSILQLQQQLIDLKQHEKLLMALKNKQNMTLAIKKNKEEELSSINIVPFSLLLKLSFDYPLNGDYMADNADQLTIFENHYKELKTMYDVAQQRSKIENQLKLLTIDSVGKVFTLVDLQEAIANENTYKDNDALFKQLDLTHDLEDVNDYVEHLTKLLDAQELLVKQDQLSLLNKKLSLLPNYDIDYSKYDTTALQAETDQLIEQQGSLQTQLKQLIESQNSIKCPHCEKDVLYKNGQLVKVTVKDDLAIDSMTEKLTMVKNTITFNKTKINKLKSEEQSVKKATEEQVSTKNHLIKEIALLTDCINKLPPTDVDQLLTAKEKEGIYKTLLKLKNVKIVSLPIHPSSDIKAFFQNKEKFEKQQQLYNQLDDLPTSLYNILSNDLVLFDTFIKTYKFQLNKLVLQQDRKLLLEKQITDMVIEDVEDLTFVQLQMADIADKIDKSVKANEMINQHDLLANDRDILLEVTNKANYLGELKQIASDVECRQLEGLVSTISSHVYDVCENMFDQEIKIDIHLYKLLKSARVKPCVNFSVIYKGGKYDSVQDLSSGELDRVSLAMTLALNRISTGHVIMFDETFKSLNQELQMDVVKIIKENCNSMVFIVDHDGLEAMFDHVIDVDQLDQYKFIA